MGKRSSKKSTATTTSVPNPNEDLKRHLEDLGLASVEAYRAWCRQNGFATSVNKDWRERAKERQTAEKLKAEGKAREDMEWHARELGFGTLEAYQAWCETRGLNYSLHKSEAQKQREKQMRSQERAQEAMAASRRLSHRPEEVIRELAAGTLNLSTIRTPNLVAIGRAFQSIRSKPVVTKALLRLILHLRENAGLFDMQPVVAALGAREANTYLFGLVALAHHYKDWRREPEYWKPETRNPRRQFASLARWLLAQYDVPLFMDAAWLSGVEDRARKQQEWFKHIGNGQNLRTADIPIALTKKAAHYALQAPRETTVEGGLRWGQVLGMGGDEYLAKALLGTRLAEAQQDEAFWATVVQFLVNNPMLAPAQIGPMLDYIHHIRFVPQQFLDADGRVERVGPLEPEFSMKGRTVPALMRRVEEWHRNLAKETRRGAMEWARSEILEFVLAQRERHPEARDGSVERKITWTIQELLSSKELNEEGKAMHHCVATYAPVCVRGTCSIWSLGLAESHDPVRRRIMTIEVNNEQRMIVQARGRFNSLPGQKHASARLNQAADVLRRWAEDQGLTIAPYVLRYR